MDRKTLVKVMALSLVVITILPIFSTTVSAMPLSRSGELVEVSNTVIVQPDPNVNWTVNLNVANTTDYDLTDYNLTWIPFFDNNTDINGILVHSMFAPLIFTLNATNQTVSIGSFFRLTPETLMDGASEVWFRLPLLGIPDNASIRMRVGRIASSVNFNVSLTGFQTPVFDEPQYVSKVYDLTLDPNALNYSPSADGYGLPNSWIDYKRWQNVSVRGLFDYNFTYVKACFPLFPNEWYFVETDVYVPYNANMTLAITQSDMGNDGRRNGWLWMNGTSVYIPADLDMPFVATYGVANGITGIGARTSYSPGGFSVGRRFHMNASIGIHEIINTAHVTYFEVLVPFMRNSSLAASTPIEFMVTLYSSDDDSVPFHSDRTTGFDIYESTYGFLLMDTSIIGHNGVYLDHIRLDIRLHNYDTNEVKLWGTQDGDVWTGYGGFTDVYWNGTSNLGFRYDYIMGEKQWFIPYGYYGLSNTRWDMTNYSIITIPMVTPKDPLEVREMIEQFDAWLTAKTEDGKDSTSHDIFETMKGFWDWLVKETTEFMVGVVYWFLTDTIVGDVIFAVVGLANIVIDFFAGVGHWLYDIITMVIDALEWFSFWFVRIIYSFSMAIVYMVNIFGVISIQSALFSASRTGKGTDFVRSFKIGWRFIFAIISLLLSLAIMAISIVSAVVPL